MAISTYILVSNFNSFSTTLTTTITTKDSSGVVLETFTHTETIPANSKNNKFSYSDEPTQTSSITTREAILSASGYSSYTLSAFGASNYCVVNGTKITLKNGKYKFVEDIKADDEVLVFNHETGKIETSQVVFNDSENEREYEIIWLEFSNGTKLGIAGEHGFFSKEINKYTYLSCDNYQDYIGKEFITFDSRGKKQVIKLINAYIKKEKCRLFSPTTYKTLNYFTNGILSLPGGVSGIFNIFDYDKETLKYINKEEDIAKYGLFTLSDYNGLINEEMFNAFNGEYLKIALGKGLLTQDYLEYMANRYKPFCE